MSHSGLFNTVRLQTLRIILMMSSSVDNAANNAASPLASQQTPSYQLHHPLQTPSSHSSRPLQREGAFRFETLTPEEMALEDAMNRSSPPPQILGKRTHNDEGDEGDTTEPDEDSPRNGEQDSLASSKPSISNVTISSQRYASKKKLRPEQRDELDAFLLVSFLKTPSMLMSDHRAGYGAWQAG